MIVSTLQVYSSRYREGMNYLMALPLDGGKPRMIVPVEHKPVGKRSGDGPVWSPDGKQMAYVSEGVLHGPRERDGRSGGFAAAGHERAVRFTELGGTESAAYTPPIA